MNERIIKSLNEMLIAETSDIEFKESLEMSKTKSWLKTVSALLIRWESYYGVLAMTVK